MEPELLGILRVKVVAKDMLLESLGTQRQAVFAMRCLFLKLSVFLVKQYTSLIYVK